MSAYRICCIAVSIIIAVFTMDYCNARRNTTEENVQVQILPSFKVTSLWTIRALKARLRKMKKRVRFGGELDFTKGFYLHADRDFAGGCRRVRLSRFIGNKDRNCTSLKPVRYSVCGGFCLPKFRLTQIIFGHDYKRIMEKAKFRWRCVSDTYKYKKVRVICPDDGSVVRYRIKVISGCVCKEFKRQHNSALTPDEIIERRKRLGSSTTT